MLQSILESSYHGLNRFLVDLEKKRKLGGVKGDPKKIKFSPFFWKHPIFGNQAVFFRAILSLISIKLGLSSQKIALEVFYYNWLRCYGVSKLREDKILKNRIFSVFWITKIFEISQSENFGTRGLHWM